ncbi:MAG TPA: aminotransferase class IV [Bryobacteraceae bacterium]|nr:aminotransferase class IV [Bryobacteraceae bacterium]
MHRFLLHNDEIRDAGENLVSPGQVGLLNGWGVFSTIRIYDGVMFEWDRHWARMKRDAAKMRVPFPPDSEWLEQRLYRLIEANQASNATLRVVVIRNRGGMWEGPSVTREFDVVAFTAGVNPWGDGVRLAMAPNARYAANEFAGTKYLSWSENLVRYERAHENGFDEVVLLNERGEIAECTSANIFIAQGSRVWTPPLISGCLPGITRAVLLEEIYVEGIEIGEKTLLAADLEAAEEVFVTSTTRELLPVYSVEGLRIRRAQSVMERLQLALSDYVSRYVGAHRRPVSVVSK